MSGNDHIHFSGGLDFRASGEPHIVVRDGGERLQIYPVDDGTSLCLFFSPANWRKLNAAVEAAIANHAAAAPAGFAAGQVSA